MKDFTKKLEEEEKEVTAAVCGCWRFKRSGSRLEEAAGRENEGKSRVLLRDMMDLKVEIKP